ncbi:Asp23/Gls24 family envelope stress response protein [Nocardioides sp. ChNu-153]|uniref:hypothetical protein n=1 Tax=unclassified Nocardioides TaxID=2615069 RepID=UPI002406573E|nr:MULTISPECIES: hypothetical protein [unclassified Nocardioides]MDF9714756.1 Asp23/Gls24 family envelope stress response protein [Nocardioides sp. ChNu-99]MDN7120118.1 Asp23/Gls24 family envelope stress response protein [Nocardioides sp. ChNu-153]
MAEQAVAPTRPTVPAHRGEPAPDDAENRGTLEVRTTAVRTLVERAVLETPGTVAHRSALGRLTGQGSPRADVEMHGRSARVSADVAAVWPCSVTAIAAGVRDRVRERAARLSGVHISTVDVTVHVVSPDDVDSPRRRVE